MSTPSIFERFTDRARRVVVLTQEEARMLNHNYVGTEHLLLGLLHEGEGVAAQALDNLGISLKGARQQVAEIIGLGQQAPSGHMPFTPRAKKVLELAFREALQLRHDYIETEHLLLGLVREGGGVGAQVLVNLGTDLDRVQPEVLRILRTPLPAPEPTPPPPTPLLDRFSRNLSREVTRGELDPVIGRRREIERLTQILAQRHRNVPLLMGEPGVGKTSIVTGLARAIASGTVPPAFADRTARSLDLGSVFTDPLHHGRFAGLVTGLLAEIRQSGLVLFLDNALTVLRTQDGRAEVLAFLRPLLGEPGVYVVAACTTAEFRRRTPDPGLDRLLHPLEISEPPLEDVLEILRVIRPRLEEHHDVVIADDALDAAAALARDHLPGQALPGSAIELLDEASAQAGARSAAVRTDALTEEYEERIDQQRIHRDAAIANQELEAAAHHERESAQLVLALADHRKALIENEGPGRRVDETDVASALALHSRLPATPSDDAHDRPPHPATGTTVPRPAAPHDPSVWAMS